MAGQRRNQAVNWNVTINATTVQEGDSISLENTETNIINPNIQQMNINQQGNDDAPEDPDPLYENGINQVAEAMNLSSQELPSMRKRRGRSPASGGEITQDFKGEKTSDFDRENDLIKGRTGTQGNAELKNARKTSDSQNDADSLLEQNQRRGQFCSSSRFIFVVSFLGVLLTGWLSYEFGHYGGYRFVQNEEYKYLQSEILKDKAVFFCAQSNFTRSDSLLEQLTSVPEHEVMSVPLALRSAECYAYLGMQNKTEEAIKVTRELLTTSQYDAKDVVDSAIDLIGHGQYFRAIVLLRIASTMYKSHKLLSPDDIVVKIYDCAKNISNAITLVVYENKSDNIPIKYATRYTIEIRDDIREIKSADPENRAKQEARCLFIIQTIYRVRERYEKSIKFGEEGVEILGQRFGYHAQEQKVYGLLLHQIGVAYNNLKNHGDAELFFNKAHDALKNALDFDSEDAKLQSIDISRTNQKIAHAGKSRSTKNYVSRKP